MVKKNITEGEMSYWPTCKQEFDSVYFFLPSEILGNCFVPCAMLQFNIFLFF